MIYIVIFHITSNNCFAMPPIKQVESLTTIRVRNHHLAPHGIQSAIMSLMVQMAIVVVTCNNVPVMLGILDIVIA